MGLLSWLRKSARTSGAAGALGVFNEIYHPSAYSAQIIVEQQQEALKPKPTPEDKPNREIDLKAKVEESNDSSTFDNEETKSELRDGQPL